MRRFVDPIVFVGACFALILAWLNLGSVRGLVTVENIALVSQVCGSTACSDSERWFIYLAAHLVELILLAGAIWFVIRHTILRLIDSLVARATGNGRNPHMTQPQGGAPAQQAPQQAQVIQAPPQVVVLDQNPMKHVAFMHQGTVKTILLGFFPVAGIVSPILMCALHALIFWQDLVLGVSGSGGWLSPDRWMLRIYAIYVIIQGGAAVFRGARKVGRMIGDILLSTTPLFVDAVALYAHGFHNLMLSSYAWGWLEGSFWYVLLIDVVIFSTFMATIDFYTASIYRYEQRAQP